MSPTHLFTAIATTVATVTIITNPVMGQTSEPTAPAWLSDGVLAASAVASLAVATALVAHAAHVIARRRAAQHVTARVAPRRR